MNTEKRNLYIQHLYGAMHTLSGKADYLDVNAAVAHPLIKTAHPKTLSDGSVCYYWQMNPNKVCPGTMLKSYSDFKKVLDETLAQIGAVDPQVTRADMALNSDYEEDYELFKKLNRLIICCIAEAYNIKNCYQTHDLWSCRSLSIAIKSNAIEAENYNKELESQGQVDTKNRLEFRSLRINDNLDSIKHEFVTNWFERLDRAIEQFGNVQAHYNRELVRIWKEDVAKPKDRRDFSNYIHFLLTFKDCLFTSKQLEALIDEMGIDNAKGKAKKFKNKHKQVEFYSLKDLQIIVKAIKKAIKVYFRN